MAKPFDGDIPGWNGWGRHEAHKVYAYIAYVIHPGAYYGGIFGYGHFLSCYEPPGVGLEAVLGCYAA